jgi:hypothetical protein
VIGAAKNYARKHGKSLSAIIENYLKLLSAEGKANINLSPKVIRLMGVIKLPEIIEHKTIIRSNLIKKYK